MPEFWKDFCAWGIADECATELTYHVNNPFKVTARIICLNLFNSLDFFLGAVTHDDGKNEIKCTVFYIINIQRSLRKWIDGQETKDTRRMHSNFVLFLKSSFTSTRSASTLIFRGVSGLVERGRNAMWNLWEITADPSIINTQGNNRKYFKHIPRRNHAKILHK